MSIVRKIQILCTENNTTLTALERELKFSKSSISRWDNNSPSADKVVKLANYFNVSTDYLLGLSKYKNEEAILKSIDDSLEIQTKLTREPYRKLSYGVLEFLKQIEIAEKDFEVIDLDRIISLSSGILSKIAEIIQNAQFSANSLINLEKDVKQDTLNRCDAQITNYIDEIRHFLGLIKNICFHSIKKKAYKNEEMVIQFSVGEDYSVKYASYEELFNSGHFQAKEASAEEFFEDIPLRNVDVQPPTQ